MLEFDFTTEEGKQGTKEIIEDIVNNNDKVRMTELLFSMMEFIVKHEANFEMIKEVL